MKKTESECYSFIGFEEIVEILIERGANVNAVDRKNDSVLILAASKGNIKYVIYVLFSDFLGY